MPPQRLIRRRPLTERLRAYFDPRDFLLWVSEGLDASDWDQWSKDWGTSVGIGMNILMLIARANTGQQRGRVVDDVFSDEKRSDGWLGWLASFVVQLLSLFSFLNAAYTFYRKRHYRLFEASVDDPPSTPSARRVRVDSSPMSSSPLRFLTKMLAADTAESRAHQDPTRDVWELSVWDPLPLCLKMFGLFSPGHILVYWLFLPTSPQDLHPSKTVITTIALVSLLSTQLSILQTSFLQQSKDASVIQREVLNEYDIKYVHPISFPLMRDVGTQFSGSRTLKERPLDTVDTYSPIIVVNRGFRTKPNPNYLSHVDPEGVHQRKTPYRHSNTGLNGPKFQPPSYGGDLSSPLQPRTSYRQAQLGTGPVPGNGDGGSLGVYSHAQSPLRKAASTNFAEIRDLDRSSSPVKRDGSPSKRISTSGAISGLHSRQRYPHLSDLPARRESGRF